MVVFDVPKYKNSMDLDKVTIASDEKPLGEMSVKNIGISTNPTADQTQQLKARIFQGASRVELGFMGRGKGSKQGRQTTPEMYGQDERRDMRELAKINEIKLSTHASPNAGPMSGMTQGKFDPQAREKVLHEIQRAIDFAADTARGGTVVVHAGEFPRSIQEWYGKDEHGKHKFRGFEDEDKEGTMYLVDSQTGKLIEGVRKDQKVQWPKYEKDENGHIIFDDEGYPQPIFDNDKWQVETADWNDFERYADSYNQWLRKNKPKNSNGEPREEITPEQAFYRAQLDTRIQYAKGWANQYNEQYKEAIERKEKFEDALKSYQKLEDNMDPDEYWKIEKMIPNDQLQLVPPDVKRPTQYLQEQLDKMDQQIQYAREMAVSQYQQAREYEKTVERAQPIDKYAIKRSATTIAKAAEFAYNKSKALQQKGKLKSPISVSVENIDPDMYGAHPQELKKLIQVARKKFIERNKKRLGESKAKKAAQDHINATFDVGHAYMWRKYYQGDPNKSFEENSKEFNKWLLNQVEDLNKEEYIKHVHISDNFGWNDEHVTPGQGIVPIKEFVKRMKDAGMKDLIVEPAHQDYRAMLGGWREFGAPIYGATAPKAGNRWSDIQHSYFGKARTPYFVFGGYAPNREEFTLWSQVPLE
ncbi:MAG: hypothetical protein MAG795_00289 [Candidatus Woesearchaeota archaeon]|nr:hypothetical protein [Candidatus Woesearchaeota archaeon]